MPEAYPILERMTSQGLTILVEQRNLVLAFASDRPGVEGIRQLAMTRPDLLDGADVALPAVGLGVAYLLIGCKVGRVFCKVMTHEAHKAFDAEGIEHGSRDRTKRLAADDPLGALDDRAREAPTMLSFVEELKHRP